MMQRRRDLMVLIAFLMAGATCLQELTRGLFVNAMVPTVFVGIAVVLGLQMLVKTFELRDRQAAALVREH
jgi:hypothetical protein